MMPVALQQLLGSYPPALAEPRRFSTPSFQRAQLANGLKVVLAERHTVPLIHLHCLVPAGAQSDPRGLEGLASMTMPLLREGTEKRNANQITEEEEALGADILTCVDWHTGSLVIELLAADVEYGIGMLFDLLNSPVFPEQAVEIARKRQAAWLEQKWQPADLANRWFARMIYGGGLYGRSLNGTKSGVLHIGREHLIGFHRAHFALNKMILIGVGSFDSGELVRKLESIPPNQCQKEVSDPPDITPLALNCNRVCLVEFPHPAQTEIRIGHAGIPQSHPDFGRLQLLTWILGKRLSLVLREHRGLAYSIRSRLVMRRGPGPFVTAAGVCNKKVGESVSEIVNGIERLQQEPVSETEVICAQNHRKGMLLRSLQSGHELAAQLKQVAANNLPDHYFHRYVEKICSVDRESLMGVARRHLRPDRLAIVAVGTIAEMRGQLSCFGEVQEIIPED